MFHLNFSNFKKTLLETLVRFPLSVLIVFSVFSLFIMQIAHDDLSLSTRNLINKSILSLIVVFFFSLAIYFFAETEKFPNKNTKYYQLLTVLFGGLYYHFFEENLFANMSSEIMVYIILTLLGIFAFVFFAPFVLSFFKKELSQDNFYIFSYNLILKILMAVIVGIATMLLGFIALSALFSLFNLDSFIDRGNAFAYWASFSLSFFAPLFFLSNLLFLKKGTKEDVINNKFYSFLSNFIFLPAIFVYFLILYAYSIKVLTYFSNWPKGEVSWMVIIFSFLAYLSFFSSYVFEQKYKIVKLYRKVLPFAVLFQTPMLFYAIFLRINQYDITINRYLVLVFGFWLLGLSLYFIISRKKRLETIFYSLAIIIIIISIGPWSVYVFPEKRQEKRLKYYLEEAQILKDNKIIPLEKYNSISPKLSGQIYGSIKYLCKSHGIKTLESLFSSELKEIREKDLENFLKNKERQIKDIKNNQSLSEKTKEERIEKIKERKYREIYLWDVIRQLTTKIKVRPSNHFNQKESLSPQYFDYVLDYRKRMQDNLKISGFDYYLELNSPHDSLWKEDEKNNQKIYSAFLDSSKEELTIYYGNYEDILNNKEKCVLESFSLHDNFKNILKKYKPEELNDGLNNSIKLDDPNILSFDLSGEKINAHLQLYAISIKNPEWEKDKKEDVSIEKDILPERGMIKFAEGIVLIHLNK